MNAITELTPQHIQESSLVPDPVAPISVAEPEVRFVLPDTAEGCVKRWVAQDSDSDVSERRTVEEMAEDLAAARDFDLSHEEIGQVIAQYAPNAPHRVECITSKPSRKLTFDLPSKPPYPPELEPLVQSGVAFISDYGSYMVKRCKTCGKFDGCGHNNSYETPAIDYTTHELTDNGRQAVGLDPIRVPIRKPTPEPIPTTPLSANQIMWSGALNNHWSPGLDWRNLFKGAGELEGSGSIKMYVENFIPEGITLICGLPKEGKSFLALSVAKALTTGQALFGRVG